MSAAPKHLMHSLSITVFLLVLLAACAAPALPTATVLPPSATSAPPTLARPTATPLSIPDTTAQNEASAQLRIVQAAPESGSIDIYLEQALIAGQLGPGSFTNPVKVAAGSYALQAVPTGTERGDQILTSATLELQAQSALIVIITGTADILNVAVYEEDLSPIEGENSRLSFINAVPRGPLAAPQVGDTTLDIELDFGQASDPRPVAAQAQEVRFNNARTQLASLQTAFAPRRSYTAILTGQVGGGDYRILLLNTPIATPGQIQVIHAAANTGEIDVILNGESIAAGLRYREHTDWLPQPATTYQLRIQAAGMDSAALPIETAAFILEESQTLQILVIDPTNGRQIQIINPSLQPTSPTATRLMVFNALPDAPVAYAIASNERIEDIPPVSSGIATGSLDLPAAAYDLMWQSRITTSSESNDEELPPVVEFSGSLTLEPGWAYTYVLTGAERNPLIVGTEVGIEAESDSIIVDNNTPPDADALNLRLINATHSTQRFQMLLNETLLFEDTTPLTTSAYTRILTNTYTLRIEGPGIREYEQTGLQLQESDTPYAIILFGDPQDLRVNIAEDYTRPIPNTQAVVRVIHATAALGEVFVSIQIPGIGPTQDPEQAVPNVAGTPLAITATPVPQNQFGTYESSNFGPGSHSGFVGLPANTYNIWVYDKTTREAVAVRSLFPLEGGRFYDMVLLPEENTESYALLLVAETDSE